MTPFNVFFVDPGSWQSGWAEIHVDELLRLHVVQTGISPNNDVCDRFRLAMDAPALWAGYEGLTAYGNTWGADLIDAVRMTGRLDQIAYDTGMVLLNPTRPSICRFLAGGPVNGKGHMWAIMVERFGAPGTKKKPGRLFGIKDHARDAFEGCVFVADKLVGEARRIL